MIHGRPWCDSDSYHSCLAIANGRRESFFFFSFPFLSFPEGVWYVWQFISSGERECIECLSLHLDRANGFMMNNTHEPSPASLCCPAWDARELTTGNYYYCTCNVCFVYFSDRDVSSMPLGQGQGHERKGLLAPIRQRLHLLANCTRWDRTEISWDPPSADRVGGQRTIVFVFCCFQCTHGPVDHKEREREDGRGSWCVKPTAVCESALEMRMLHGQE